LWKALATKTARQRTSSVSLKGVQLRESSRMFLTCSKVMKASASRTVSMVSMICLGSNSGSVNAVMRRWYLDMARKSPPPARCRSDV